MAKGKNVVVGWRISPELHRFLIQQSGQDLMTISTWIRRALSVLHAQYKTKEVPAWHGGEPASKGKRGRSAS